MKYMILSGEPNERFSLAAQGLVRTDDLTEAELIIGEPTMQEVHRAKKLSWLQMTWAGADRYQNAGFPENVVLTTASGAYGQTIAEHVLAMLFALCRRLPSYARRNDWVDLGSEKQITGGTAVIFGAGDIGTQLALRLKALGVKTVGVCRDARRFRPGFDIRTTLEAAEAFLPKADFVLCALPHSEQTQGYFNDERLRLVKEDAVLVNVGRGSLIDTEALTRQLTEGRFFGVGLDVVVPEPLERTHPLRSIDRVLLTPHIAGVGFSHLKDTEERIWEICAENLENYRSGKPLRNVVKP